MNLAVRTATVDLRHALSTMGPGREGTLSLLGAFPNLHAGLHVAACAKSVADGDRIVQANRLASHIVHDLWSMQTLALRIDREHERTAAGEMDGIAYHMFVGCDLHLFLVEARSVFDYLAQLIVLGAHQRGQLSVSSFNGLRKWLRKNPERIERVLGLDLAGVVLGCTWFDEVKAPRDAVVHGGGQALCMWSGSEEVTFSLLMVAPAVRELQAIWQSRTSAMTGDFRIFAALCFGRLIALLENASPLLAKRFDVDMTGDAKMVHSGLAIMQRWIELALVRLEG